jgi:opacity protein-like surface antigen
LRELFVSTGGFSLTAGQRTESGWAWEGIIELARFSQSNTERLYYPDVSLKLDLYGGGVRASYYPFKLQGAFFGLFHPYLAGGATLYRWFYHRGAYSPDTTSAGEVPERKLADWSLGFRAGGGVELFPTQAISLSSQVSYNAVIGEIWPTLALRIDGVSVFQMAEVFVGIKYYFGR